MKEADKDIARAVREKGLMWHREEYLHDYPFCWRAEQDPLIQYPRKSWFIRTSKFKDDMLSNNSKINWQPEHIKQAVSATSSSRTSIGPFRANAIGGLRYRSGFANRPARWKRSGHTTN